MIGWAKIQIGISHAATRAARPGASLLSFGLAPKPSRRTLAVAARLRRATHEAVANAIARRAYVVSGSQSHRCEQSPVARRSIRYSPLEQLIAWAVARLG